MNTLVLDQVIGRGRTLFQDTNPYVPAFNEESSSVKKRAKLMNYEKKNVISGFSVVNENIPIKLLTDGSERSSQVRTEPGVENRLTVHKTATPVEAASGPRMSSALTTRKPVVVPTPEWHAPWELSAVVSGHLGWVRSIAFDPSNEWFVTGSADRTIKVWDFAKCCAGAEGGLKLTLTGHISAVRGLAVSSRHPYLFSGGEDKTVKCWDLEQNKVVRHYHGHLSAVYSLALHPTLDILITGGRDSVARVWDMRTNKQVHVLGGHNDAVSSLLTNAVDPQIVTGSHDTTIKLWDLAAGRALTTLTHHKKSVRSLAASPREFSFVSGAPDNIKKWQMRDGTFLKNMSGHNSPINAVAVNDDGVLVSCGDNGSINFWDYETGYCFQKSNTIAQPGSLDAETGIFAAAFDLSGSRLVTCEADKSIKIWKENAAATEESDPIDMKGWTKDCLALKKH